jgi:transitional endoplasmic reticulum ATPase
MSKKHFRTSFDRLLALWIVSIFTSDPGRSKFIVDSQYADSDIAKFLGLPYPIDEGNPVEITRAMDRLSGSLEAASAGSLPARAKANFLRLSETLKLTTNERMILEFFACMKTESPLIDTVRVIREAFSKEPSRVLAKVLGIPRTEAAKALAPTGRLIKCGLLKSSNHSARMGMLEICSEDLAIELLRETYDPRKLLRLFGVVSPAPPQLRLGDYPHLQTSLDLLIPYLTKIRRSRRSGVNVLVHGPPGTGKSQLVRVLGKHLDTPVFELATSDSDGDPLYASARLSVLNLAQSYFHDSPVLLVFDEAEDIFKPSRSNRSMADSHKGWFNQILEQNRQPVFWISNSLDDLDPAFSRRFDFVVEVPIPPKAQRRRILNETVGDMVSPAMVEKLAELDHLAPAVVGRARDVIATIRREIPKEKMDGAFSHLIGGILKAQKHPDPNLAAVKAVEPSLYDIGHLNTSTDLRGIASNLRKDPSARLCLYGPPGTGKTSFGHWLAKELGQPLHLQKASDLLRPYVGMTEQNIAKAFERAKEEGAVLLIDEVDSFLRDRGRVRHSWEVVQVNEMLTQIESFPGILVASTNLIDQLDEASMRRFDIKLHFGYLLPEQAVRLFESHCRNLNLPLPTTSDIALAYTLDCSAPGDFAAVARRHRFQPFRSAHDLLLAVQEEVGIRSRGVRTIGFH